MPTGLVFLPGMMCDERLFAPQISHLSNLFEIETADLATAKSIEDIASLILTTVKFDVFSLCGLSMGGVVAFELMKQAPDRINKVALLNTNHLADAPSNRPIRLAQLEKAQAGKLRDVIVEEMKPKYLSIDNRAKTELLQLLIQMALDLGEDAFINQSLALLNRPDYSQVLENWKKPTLIIGGQEDQLCPPSRHIEMHELLESSQLQLIEKAGHISTLEQPDTVNQLLISFLKP